MPLDRNAAKEMAEVLNAVLDSSRGVGMLKQKKVAATMLGVMVPLYGAWIVFEHSVLLALGFVLLANFTIWIYIITQGKIDVADRQFVATIKDGLVDSDVGSNSITTSTSTAAKLQ